MPANPVNTRLPANGEKLYKLYKHYKLYSGVAPMLAPGARRGYIKRKYDDKKSPQEKATR